MKLKYILITLPIILLTACSNISPKADDGFELKGKLSNANGKTIYFERMDPQGVVPVDTIVVSDKGEFSTSTTIPEIGFYRLRISEKNFATFIFDNDQHVSITGDANDLGSNYQVKGSPDSQLLSELTQRSTSNYQQRDSLQKVFQTFANAHQGDTAIVNRKGRELDVPFMKLINDQSAYLAAFITKNSTSFAAIAAIQQLKIEDDPNLFIQLSKSLSEKYPSSSYVQAFSGDVQSKTACAIGTPAPEISYNDVDGKPLLLSSLKGKVVLIDFWASWCRPCRAENPNLVRAYNKFKDKGFEIYSVSLDTKLEKWKYAIAKDNLSWKSHVSDFGGWKSSVVRAYNFNGIPYSVLIDQEGTIIAKNLRGAELDRILSEVLK